MRAENDKAIILELPGGEYEVWMKLFYTGGENSGALICPRDEDFGVKAWSTYTEKRAMEIFDEITTGKRGITPMVEIISEA